MTEHEPPDYLNPADCRCLCHQTTGYVGSLVSRGETSRLLAGMHDSIKITTNVKPPGAKTWPERQVDVGYSFEVRHSAERATWCCTRAVHEYGDAHKAGKAK